jgi:hypothetical protein
MMPGWWVCEPPPASFTDLVTCQHRRTRTALSACGLRELPYGRRGRTRTGYVPGTPPGPLSGAVAPGRRHALRTVAFSITTVALGGVFCVLGSGVDPALAIFFSTSMPPVIFPNGV